MHLFLKLAWVYNSRPINEYVWEEEFATPDLNAAGVNIFIL